MTPGEANSTDRDLVQNSQELSSKVSNTIQNAALQKEGHHNWRNKTHHHRMTTIWHRNTRGSSEHYTTS